MSTFGNIPVCFPQPPTQCSRYAALNATHAGKKTRASDDPSIPIGLVKGGGLLTSRVNSSVTHCQHNP